MLFQEIDCPIRHAKFTNKHDARWYSWSPYFRQEFRMFKKQLDLVPRPELLYIKRHQDYNYSYSIDIAKADKFFIKDFKNFALSLYYFDPKEYLNLFTCLIAKDITNQYYSRILAVMRAILVAELNDPMGALYAPLTPGKDQSDFPLHCDLYIPKILFNVFGQVASDGSGKSTFLRLNTFFSLLDEIEVMPIKIKSQLKRIFKVELRVDHYEKFYGLLYDPKNQWCASLKKALNREKIVIGLQKGEGYMINDRIWMHGRDRTNGGISAKRLHRLIFTNIYQNNHLYAKPISRNF